MRWLEVLVQSMTLDVMGPDQVTAIKKLILREPLSQKEAAIILYLAGNSGIDSLDTLELQELEEWLEETFDLKLR